MIYVSHDAAEVKPHRQPRGAAGSAARVTATGGAESARRWRTCDMHAAMFPPARIVCLTEETVETLYLLGEDAPHCRRVRLCGAAAAECARKSRASRPSSPPTCRRSSRSKPDLVLDFLRSAGRHRRRADPRQCRRARLQPARRRRHPRHDPHARRAGRRGGQGRARWRGIARRARRCRARARAGAAAPAARLFRGMGRADDLRPRLGVGTGRGRRRHRGVPAAGRAQERQGPHRLGRRR